MKVRYVKYSNERFSDDHQGFCSLTINEMIHDVCTHIGCIEVKFE